MGGTQGSVDCFLQVLYLSKIKYGLEVYSSASMSELKKLEVVQNNAIRIITGLLRSTPIEAI